MQAALVVLDAATKTKSSPSSSGAYDILIIGAIFLVLYLLFLRPRSQRMRQQREQLRQATVGETVVTIGGLVGQIVAEDGDKVTISTGSGTELVFLRQAIGRKLDSAPAEPDAAGSAAPEPGFEGPPPGFEDAPTPEPDTDHSEHGTS